jgi:glutamate synthase (NADPH/NADH) large chain
VRNSGVTAVVEGAGDHCAEYMTGGRVVVLGEVGRNFAAGMSGGIAYVLNTNGKFAFYCNHGMVELAPVLDMDEQLFLKMLIEKHVYHTNSDKAQEILDHWSDYLPQFVKVLPLEYKRVLEEMRLESTQNQLAFIREEEELGEPY